MSLSKEKIAQWFRSYPQLTILHFVGDKAFLEIEDAKEYAEEFGGIATTLEKTTDDDGELVFKAPSETETVTLTKEEAQETLKTLELDAKGNYKQYQALVKTLDLNPDGTSKASLIAVLQVAKESLLNPQV